MYDLGDPVPLGITVRDSAGAAADAGSVALTVTLPDGTTSSPAVTRDGTGLYSATYVPTLAGPHAYRWVATGQNACAHADVFTVVDPLAGLVSLADVRSHLGAVATGADEELRRYVLVGTELAEEWLGRTLRRRTVVELHDGGGVAVLLRQGPVSSVTSVSESGTALAAGAGYVVDASAGIVYRGSSTATSSWASGVQNVSVAYVVAPDALSLARCGQGVREIVRHLWDTQRGGSALPRQAGAGDDWVSGTGYSVPRRVMELLGTRTSGLA